MQLVLAVALWRRPGPPDQATRQHIHVDSASHIIVTVLRLRTWQGGQQSSPSDPHGTFAVRFIVPSSYRKTRCSSFRLVSPWLAPKRIIAEKMSYTSATCEDLKHGFKSGVPVASLSVKLVLSIAVVCTYHIRWHPLKLVPFLKFDQCGEC